MREATGNHAHGKPRGTARLCVVSVVREFAGPEPSTVRNLMLIFASTSGLSVTLEICALVPGWFPVNVATDQFSSVVDSKHCDRC